MPIEVFPEAPEEKLLHEEAPVTMPDMVEGELLSLSQEELRDELERSEALAARMLEMAHMPPETCNPDMLSAWISVDPNMLTKLPVEHLSKVDRLRLAKMLWGAVGSESTYFYDAESGRSSNVSMPDYRLSPSFRNALQHRIVFAPPGKDERGLEELRIEALTDAMRRAPDKGAALAEECKANGLEELAEEAKDRMRRKELSLTGENNTDSSLETSTADATPEDVLQAMAEQDEAATRYAAYAKRQSEKQRRRRKDPWFDFEELPAAEEEEEMEIAVRPARPVRELLMHNGDNVWIQKSDAQWSPVFMVAAVRYVRSHPDSLTKSYEQYEKDASGWDQKTGEVKTYDETDTFINTLMTNIERLPREQIPEEVLQFIAEHVENPDWKERAHLRLWPWLDDAKDIRTKLERYFANYHEQHAVTTALKQARGVERQDRQSAAEAFDTPRFSNDPRAFKILSAWLKDHQPYQIHTAEAFERTMLLFKQQAASYTGEQGELPRSEIRFRHRGGGGSAHQAPWEVSSALAPTFLRLCYKHLPLTDALSLCMKYSGYPWPDDPLLGDLCKHHIKKPEDGWRVWEALQALGNEACATFLEKNSSMMLKTFQSDLPRACTCISRDVLNPLLEELQKDTWRLELFAGCLELLAMFDVAEAKAMLEKSMSTPGFQAALRGKSEWYAKNWFPKLLRVCYGNLSYPTPAKKPYLDMAERAEKPIPSPLAMMLHFEAQGGTPWAARPVPVLNHNKAEEAWFRIVHDQTYPESPNQSGDGKRSKEKQSNADRDYAQKRDQLLEDRGKPMGTGENDPDAPEMPQASHPNEHPRTVAVLSKELTGDSRYVMTKVCDTFNERWLAHEPTERGANMDLREILQTDVWNGETVTMQARLNHGAVIPLPMAASVQDVQTTNGRLRWAGHWAKRLDSTEAADVSIAYNAGPDRVPAACSLEELKHALPASLQTHSHELGRMTDLPPRLQSMLQSIDVTNLPVPEIVNRTQTIVREYYEYCFINKHPVYTEKYKTLLENMPYKTERNAYLDFIHDLREEHEDILGRGVCGQLATVLEACLRSLGVPAYFAAGYLASGKTITTNDGHAWVLVPMLDVQGQLFMKPVEATGGNISADYGPATEPDRQKEAEATLKQQKPETLPSQEPPANKGLEDYRKYFSEVLQREVTNEDLHSAAEVVRESIALQRGKPAEVSDYEALHPQGYFVNPPYGKRLETVMAERIDTLSEGTRMLLSFLLEKGREEYENIEANWRKQQDLSH